MVDTQDGWAWGRGLIATTNDGAAHFVEVTPKALAASSTAPTVSFLDSRHAWVLSHSPGPVVLLRTDDGGATWTQLPPVTGVAGWTVQSMTFVDPQHGWLTRQRARNSHTANETALLRTTDGGTTWSLVHSAVQRITIQPNVQTGDCGWLDSGIAWGSSHDGYAAVACPFDAPPTIEATSDGGSTWRRLQLPPLPPSSGITLWSGVSSIQLFGDHILAMVSRCTGTDALSCRPIGAVYSSSDRGRTWSVGESFFRGAAQLTASSPRYIWLTNASLTQSPQQSLLVSADGGRTWRSVGLPVSLWPNMHGTRAFQFLTSRLGLVVWWQEFVRKVRFFRTTDGGTTFTEFFPQLA